MPLHQFNLPIHIATIANGGKKYVPHLIKRVVKPDGSIIKENKPLFTDLNISKEDCCC